jgi:hypothetical protein
VLWRCDLPAIKLGFRLCEGPNTRGLGITAARSSIILTAYFSSSEIGEVAVVSVSEGGNACPAMFRIAYPDAAGKYVVTKEFGDYSDIPPIIFEEKQVTLRFSRFAFPPLPLRIQSGKTATAQNSEAKNKTDFPCN